MSSTVQCSTYWNREPPRYNIRIVNLGWRLNAINMEYIGMNMYIERIRMNMYIEHIGMNKYYTNQRKLMKHKNNEINT